MNPVAPRAGVSGGVHDPGLSGLDGALDAAQVARMLEAAWRRRFGVSLAIVEGEVTYVRYKPSTSLIAAYRFGTEGAGPGIILGYGRLVRAERVAEAFAKASAISARRSDSHVFLLRPIPLLFHVFPFDRRIRGLRSVMNRDKLKRIARAVVPLGSPALRVSGKRTSLSLLRYKPERRAVVAADLGLVDETTGRESRLAALLKAYADDTGRETALFSFGLAAAQPHDDAPRLARILGYDPDTGILFQERLTGRPLLEADEGTEMARRAGRCLAWLHGIPIRRRANQDRTGSWALSRCVSELQPMGDHLARIGVSDKAARARNLLTTLERRSPSSSLSAMVHGDFNHNQVLVNGGEVAFIDFDEAGAGDPRIDVGNFMAHLRYLSTGPPWIDRSLATMESAFLEGYREAGGREFESLSWFVALGLARLAAAPFRTLAQDWERETSMILDAALAQT